MGVLRADCWLLAAGGERGRHQGNATGVRSSTTVPLFSELLVQRYTACRWFSFPPADLVGLAAPSQYLCTLCAACHLGFPQHVGDADTLVAILLNAQAELRMHSGGGGGE